MKEPTLTLKVDDLLVDESLLETSTVHQLASQTKVFFDLGRDQRAARVQAPEMSLVPSFNDRTLLVKGVTRGQNGTYSSNILIMDVDYVEEGTQHAVDFTAADGSVYWILRPNRIKNDVKVSCSCLDFYYRFAVWNHKNGSLLGDAPPPYVKKTDRAPVNPDKVAGVCKHLIKMGERLRAENLLK